jgi:predicted MPP superfamily phosphohydrolase
MLRWRRSTWLWILLWAWLTAGSTWVHTRLWTDYRLWPPPPHQEPETWVRAIGNVQNVIVAPAWLVIRVVGGVWPTYTAAGAAAANAFGWAAIMGAGACVWRMRARVLRARAPASLSAPASASAQGDTGDPAAGAVNARDQGNPAILTPARADLSRRRFLVDGAGLATGALGVGLLGKATLGDPWSLEVRRYRVPIAGLPAGLEGLRLVQLSDTHLGPRVPDWFVRRAVEVALSLKPDLFVLTGDYIHDGMQHIAPAAALFRPLVQTGRPVVGVLGNHDWYGNGGLSTSTLRDMGVRMVDNRRVILDEGTRAIRGDGGSSAGLCVAGFGDLLEHHINVDTALGGVADDMPRVVLSHNPDVAEAVHAGVPFHAFTKYRGTRPRIADSSRGRARIDLMLSGHTHGGQVALPGYGPIIVPSRYGKKYAGGVVPGPGYPVVVSRGVGMSILPVRFFVPPEVVEVTLVRAS